MKIEQLHSLFLSCTAANTDTRTTQKNDMFFALKGEHFNGNTFAEKAIQLGAKYAVVDDRRYVLSSQYILVPNVLTTLQELAAYHRTYLGIPILALTGSNGKTTTKELIHTVLSKKVNVVATKGNLNNHIGVPLTLLTMNKTTEMGIVEMGANHLGEIDFLTQIVKPDYGYITNFGKAHLEGFGSVEGIIQGKSELYDYLIANHKCVFVNGNDSIQLQKTKHAKRFVFGAMDTNPDVVVVLTSCTPNVCVTYANLQINSNLIGNYNFSNIAAAIAIGHYFGIDANVIKDAIEAYVPKNNRSQILKTGTNKIILDAYNANPTSMEAAIKNMSQLPDKNKVLILGDMFELGNSSEAEHQAIIDLAIRLNFNSIIVIGKNFF